jgi:D-inositol-3-phosphate glycosyltransferase
MQIEANEIAIDVQAAGTGYAPGHDATIRVGLLTGGNDRPYALGLVSALTAQGIFVDFIASDALDAPELHGTPLINFLNLRGEQNEEAPLSTKVERLLRYYGRLLWYVTASSPKILHILWNNKFELVDRVILMLYYKSLGKKLLLTAHNTNAAKREGRDSLLNRLSLKCQYWLSDHIFVHTDRMKDELVKDFQLHADKVTVIPFGINDTTPKSGISALEAKNGLGLSADEKTVLFFGQIAPYKGLEHLIGAMAELVKRGCAPRLIVAGRIKRGCAEYWQKIQSEIASTGVQRHVIETIEFIPDDQVEVYFKAADVVILPYNNIFQSGVPFLAYSFGLPIIATDVGSLREDVVEGETGFICKPRDSVDLARAILQYFSSDLYRQLDVRRRDIKHFASVKYSWTKVGAATREVYANLLA